MLHSFLSSFNSHTHVQTSDGHVASCEQRCKLSCPGLLINDSRKWKKKSVSKFWSSPTRSMQRCTHTLPFLSHGGYSRLIPFIHSPGQLQRSTPEGAVLVAGKTPPSARLELPTSLLANSQCSTLSRLQNHHADASIGVPCGVGQ